MLGRKGRYFACAVGILVTPLLASCGNGEQRAAPSGEASAPVTETADPSTISGDEVVGPKGKRFRVQEGIIEGYVDNTGIEGDVVSIGGWAAVGDLSKPATKVIGFVKGKAIATGKPFADRGDVADFYDAPGVSQSGYVIRFDKSSLDCSQPMAGLTVLAIAGDRAGPLTWAEDIDKQIVESAC